MFHHSTFALALVASVLPICAFAGDAAAAGPLKIYILAGQSNMQGHAKVETIEHLAMDPATVPIHQDLMDNAEKPRTCEHVWISSIGHDGSDKERHGKLAANFGAAGRDAKIGPEYSFGIYTQKLVNEPILLIKTAWGGKSLNTDFRPPSAGPYVFNERQLGNFKRQDKDIDSIMSQKAEATGRYYRTMIDHIRRVLDDVKRVCPDYDPQLGYELAGFVWFQGWNDMVDGGTYPDRGQPGSYAPYSTAMAHFIRDVRKDLSSPKLPFVIGVIGVGGPIEKYGPDQKRYQNIHGEFRQAMAAPTKLPEFQGNVVAVKTEDYWDPQLAELAQRWGKVGAKSRSLRKETSPSKTEQQQQQLDKFTNELFTAQELEILRTGKSNAEYHYLGSAKILVQIGRAFAEQLNKLPTHRAL